MASYSSAFVFPGPAAPPNRRYLASDLWNSLWRSNGLYPTFLQNSLKSRMHFFASDLSALEGMGCQIHCRIRSLLWPASSEAGVFCPRAAKIPGLQQIYDDLNFFPM